MHFATLPLLFAATTLASPLHKQAYLVKRACTTGPDTATDFLAYPAYVNTASNATTPPGYANTYTNLHASSNADGYAGYTTLPTYNTTACAEKCTASKNCHAFNNFYERTAVSSSFNSSCTSTATIKCVFWNGAVTTANAVNTGSTQNNFEIVIAGSNGYVASAISPATGYSAPVYFSNSGIQAPLDCNGKDTYLGFQTFDANFDASRCAAACSAQAAYALTHLPSDGSTPKTCKFFNTYVESKNGVPQDQKCVLYSQTWSKGVATNTGYAYGKDVYAVGMSYGYSNATDAGVCVKA
ncbi:unnamed protein product [Aureobasidium uvarum]|uniref:Apple domain-containing protein n=1 Tax=Aureobasidium uvarum TaxID=2773716 RepID=A0A9N8K8I2_9PEZI|nr:unnamed protein product [Aureobasidium uvarum]